MKRLHREIANSRTYQLSWRPNATNKTDERNFSRSVLRRLPAEVLYDAVRLATASDEQLQQYHTNPVATRAIGFSKVKKRKADNYALELFGKPARLLNCDCERSAEPSLLQIVYLRNDKEVLQMLDAKNSWLKQSAHSKASINDLVWQAYLRVLSRPPDRRESDIAAAHLHKADDADTGLRDLMWALINTKEFLVNR